jgi:NTE family protein
MATSTTPPDPGPTLCLSGGGFRATLFHLGAVRRLNELGVLAWVRVVTSVSGGSILNGVLATRWQQLTRRPDGVLDGFDEFVAGPVRRFCATDLRTRLLVFSRLDPSNWPTLLRTYFAVPAEFLARGYAALLPGSLRDLPDPAAGHPRFVFCATNTATGACWQFHGGPAARMGDYYAGYRPAGHVLVADAVAASSAFPPGFAPLRLRAGEPGPDYRVDPWGEEQGESGKRGRQVHWDYTRTARLTDGGVYDNLGVEAVWDRCRTLLVSDAQRQFLSTPGGSPWLFARLTRAVDIGLEQIGAVRKRWLIERLTTSDPRRTCRGTYWGLTTRPADYPAPPPGAYGQSVQDRFHRVRTDLNAFDDGEAGCLENHGYCLADAAARSHLPDWYPAGVEFVWPGKGVEPDGNGDIAAARALAGSHRRNWLRDVRRAVCER